MSVLDAPLAKIAKAVIKCFGCNAKLVMTKTDYNELTGTSLPVKTEIPIKVSPPYPYKDSQINGTTILSGDLMFLVASADLDSKMPNPQEWNLVLKNRTFHVVTNMPIYSGEEIAAYQLQARA